jgi:hypothetical protein
MPLDSYSWDYDEGLIYSQKSTAAEELKDQNRNVIPSAAPYV